MIKENRECVSCAGEVVMEHIIFRTGGITTHMAPSKAVKAIPNLLISTTEMVSKTTVIRILQTI